MTARAPGLGVTQGLKPVAAGSASYAAQMQSGRACPQGAQTDGPTTPPRLGAPSTGGSALGAAFSAMQFPRRSVVSVPESEQLRFPHTPLQTGTSLAWSSDGGCPELEACGGVQSQQEGVTINTWCFWTWAGAG